MSIDYTKVLESRRTTALSVQEGDMLHDPIEDDPKFAKTIVEAQKEAGKLLADQKMHLGYCHLLWGTQQELLRNKHGVLWFTPAEMNPDVLFD